MIREGILAAIGHTPLIRLSRLYPRGAFQVWAKLEALNPGGSIKDRPAATILEHALSTGQIRSGTVVIESSSGNMGIGLAQACAFYRLRFICVVDPKTTPQNLQILKAYGAEVDVVRRTDPLTGEYLQARIDRVNELLAEVPDSFWPNQYANVCNARAHHQTMREIDLELNGKVDFLFCAASTCGTLRGCAEYIRSRGAHTRVIAVDAVGSVLFSDVRGKRLIPGHGAAVRPSLLEPRLADECIHVTDADCVIGCRRLLKSEAIFAGGSSGAVVASIERFRPRIPPGANCALIFADRGERYLDTVYCDEWVRQHLPGLSIDPSNTATNFQPEVAHA